MEAATEREVAIRRQPPIQVPAATGHASNPPLSGASSAPSACALWPQVPIHDAIFLVLQLAQILHCSQSAAGAPSSHSQAPSRTLTKRNPIPDEPAVGPACVYPKRSLPLSTLRICRSAHDPPASAQETNLHHLSESAPSSWPRPLATHEAPVQWLLQSALQTTLSRHGLRVSCASKRVGTADCAMGTHYQPTK